MVDGQILARFGRPLYSFTLREAISLYYGLLMENKTLEQRAELDRILNSGSRSKSAAEAVSAAHDGLLAGGDVSALFEEFG